MKAAVTIFDNDVTVRRVTAPEGEFEQSVRFSGRLSVAREFAIGPGPGPGAPGSQDAQWVCVAVRTGRVHVQTGGFDGFVVEPGRPLMHLTEFSSVYLTPGDSFLDSDGSEVDLELLVYPSQTPALQNPETFLHLNAGRGITSTTTVQPIVTNWVDTNPNTFAPDSFEWNNAPPSGPSLISSDPDFNGQPSVDFTNSGTGYMFYTGASASLFNFLRAGSGEDWTLMAVMSVPDNGTQLQRIFGSQLAANRASISIDGGYRVRYFGEAETIEDFTPDELVEKPFVLVIRHVASLDRLEVYTQSGWTTLDISGGTPSVDLGVLGLFGDQLASQFAGKVADFQLHQEALSLAEMQAYIADAVSTYGIDDTAEATFPLVSDANTINYHRSNRGVNGDVDWTDTRNEVSTTYRRLLASATGMDYVELDPYMHNHPALRGDGQSGYVENTNNWTHLSGGDGAGFTVAFVYWKARRILGQYEEPILSMGAYNSIVGLTGTSIFFEQAPDDFLTYANNDAAGSATFDEDSTALTPDWVPWLAILSVDAASSTYRIVEYDVLNAIEVFDFEGSFTEAPGATAGPVRLLDWASGSAPGRQLEAGLAEFFSGTRPITTSEVEEMQAYATRRYSAPPASFYTET